MAEIAMFGAGCFWGVEETFRKLKGVINTEVGYAGGKTPNPSYMQVCSHTTGHAEVIKISFDPQQITYDELLNVFWNIHDPTFQHAQGPDVGSQYRSIIFYHTDDQRNKAIASRDKWNNERYEGKIRTEIVPASDFYLAEEFHQRYIQKQGR